MQTELIRYRHSCNSGDAISTLPGVQYAWEKLGKKGIFMQRLNLLAQYYQGATHPVTDKNGLMVCMNEKQWQMLVPLLEAQPYIERCEVWEGQEFDINFDLIREGHFCNMDGSPIETWQFMVHPLLTCDISKPWIHVPGPVKDFTISQNGKNKSVSVEEMKGKVIINRTQRYQNAIISYFFLKKHEGNLIFSGTQRERDLFCSQFRINLPLLEVKDFLELAQALSICKFTLCNQSMIFNICNGMKSTRLLEMCKGAFNCFAIGKGGYSFLHQQSLEILFNKLIK